MVLFAYFLSESIWKNIFWWTILRFLVYIPDFFFFLNLCIIFTFEYVFKRSLKTINQSSSFCLHWRSVQLKIHSLYSHLLTFCHHLEQHLSCCSKPKRPLFIFETQMKIFFMKPERFLSFHWKSMLPKLWCFKKFIKTFKVIHMNRVV